VLFLVPLIEVLLQSNCGLAPRQISMYHFGYGSFEQLGRFQYSRTSISGTDLSGGNPISGSCAFSTVSQGSRFIMCYVERYSSVGGIFTRNIVPPAYRHSTVLFHERGRLIIK
jgi:hypothetical protein